MITIKHTWLLLISIFLSFNIFSAEVSTQQEALLKNLPLDQREAVRAKMQSNAESSQEIEKIFENENILIERPQNIEIDGDCETCIYGYEMFRFAPSTFAPANHIPISSSYTLGPGDKLEINYYGIEKERLVSFISRDGTIDLPILGPVNLAGLSFKEAKEMLQAKVDSEMMGTKFSINLTELRSITVYVLGQAYLPGSYTMSALSTVTNALFVSGGVGKQGSLRNIKVKRGSTESNYDLYDLLINGDSSGDLRLEDGDIIFIPFLDATVGVRGAFKRPHRYEYIEGETIEDAIRFAGGFANGTGKMQAVEFSTINDALNKRDDSIILKKKNFTKLLSNGDSINASGITGMKTELVEIIGEISRPGAYVINTSDTVLDVINRAGGYTSRAYTEGIVFTRDQVATQQKTGFMKSADMLESTIIDIITQSAKEVDEMTLSILTSLVDKVRNAEPIGRQVVNFDLLNLKTDPYDNLSLMNGDKIVIPKRPQSINVVGEVLNPSTLKFEPTMTTKRYLELAGGYTNSADRNKIFIILPNGTSLQYTKKFFSGSGSLLPGSTIVVSRNTRTFDAISLTQIITPILADLATSAAAIAALNN